MRFDKAILRRQNFEILANYRLRVMFEHEPHQLEELHEISAKNRNYLMLCKRKNGRLLKFETRRAKRGTKN